MVGDEAGCFSLRSLCRGQHRKQEEEGVPRGAVVVVEAEEEEGRRPWSNHDQIMGRCKKGGERGDERIECADVS